MFNRRLRGSHSVGSVRLFVHVDIGGPLSGHPQTVALRNSANSVTVSVLGHLHLADVHAGLLPALAPRIDRLRKRSTLFRSGSLRLSPQLDGHVRLLGDAHHLGPLSDAGHRCLHLFLHLQFDEEDAQLVAAAG